MEQPASADPQLAEAQQQQVRSSTMVQLGNVLAKETQANDTKRSRAQRTIILAVLTIGLVIALGLLYQWLTRNPTH